MGKSARSSGLSVQERPPVTDLGASPPLVPPVLADLWADEAAYGLARRRPVDSARTGLTPTQLTIAASLMVAMSVMLAFHPTLAGQAGLVLAGAAFIGILTVRVLALSHTRSTAPRRDLPEDALPKASILVALYREKRVLPALATALTAIRYPADRLEIKLAIEADDDETLQAARALHLDTRFEVIIVPPGSPRTKPRALNYALRFCTGEIVTIHDAEDRPHPDQLRTAAESFAANPVSTACLQAPLNWYNRDACWLTRQFALEYASHFNIMLPFYARQGWPLPLGGTSNYFRTAALRAVGGWDAHNVTEDADLGFRLAAHGYRSAVIAPATLEEAPVSSRAWIRQRSRWLKGYMQTLAVRSRAIGDQRRRAAVPVLAVTLGAAVISAILHLPLLILTAVSIAVFPVSADMLATGLGVMASGYVTAALCARTGMRRAGLSYRLFDLLSMPLYWPLQSLAALRAIWQLLRDPFYWDKTDHGHSLPLNTTAAAPCISPFHRPSSPAASVSGSSCWRDGEAPNPSDRKKGRE